MYGGNKNSIKKGGSEKGLSPYVRGKLILMVNLSFRTRSIPVCTGETHRVRTNQLSPGVYPRMYGGNQGNRQVGYDVNGLSPYVRGKLGIEAGGRLSGGSIPVCTGETVIDDQTQ